ncbi:ribitol 5-phosphate transferase FKRP-like [Glandiceps talaboti]
MRITRCQGLLVIAICVNFVGLYYVARTQQRLDDQYHDEATLADEDDDDRRAIPDGKTLQPHEQTTVILREFEDYDNGISETIKSVFNIFPTLPVVVIADKKPYPPLDVPRNVDNEVKVITLTAPLDKSHAESKPENYIHTEFLLFLPDGIRLHTSKILESMITKLKSYRQSHGTTNVRAIALKVDTVEENDQAECLSLSVDLRGWNMTYSKSEKNICDAVTGVHAILMHKHDFMCLSHPYARPLPDSLYIQTSLRKWKVMLMTSSQSVSFSRLYKNPHSRWKYTNSHQEKLTSLYNDFGIKQVVQTDGLTDWYGCSKGTSRCFGTIVDDMPEYLYHQKWTPPCCMKHLKYTAAYVFEILESAGVRYWLEGGSLLGAARQGDVIPWDYDVDIGIYKEDVAKCDQLKDLDVGDPVVDRDGYVWEKAQEGDFFRVQYSSTNHMHVDIFPFYEKDGIMTKDSWIKTHRQDTEFPEHYLKPLDKIEFIGMQVSVPNNYREFLELKFGEGVIENPQYPDPDKVKMTKNI